MRLKTILQIFTDDITIEMSLDIYIYATVQYSSGKFLSGLVWEDCSW